MKTFFKKTGLIILGFFGLMCLCLVLIVNAPQTKKSAVEATTPAETEAPQPTDTPIPTETMSTRCMPATESQLGAIRDGLYMVDKNNTVKNGWTVKSGDFKNAWFVAAKIYGPGMEDGTGPGLWITSGDPQKVQMILSVDGFANTFSVYPDGAKTDASATAFDDGAQDALGCANK